MHLSLRSVALTQSAFFHSFQADPFAGFGSTLTSRVSQSQKTSTRTTLHAHLPRTFIDSPLSILRHCSSQIVQLHHQCKLGPIQTVVVAIAPLVMYD